jgi:putative ABC transport system permease protein
VPTEGDITAIIIKTKAPIFALQLYKIINSEPLAQAAIPTREIKSLFDIVGNINWAFLFITLLVIVVALIGVMVAIYNSLNERRRDIAIMRALGSASDTNFWNDYTGSHAHCAVGGGRWGGIK